MRISPLVILCVAVTSVAQAQDAPDCHPVSPTDRVVVTMTDGQTIRGTLLCLTDRDVLLTRDGEIERTPLGSIRQIATPADPVWDGVLKGAAIPLVIWAIWCRECDAGFMLRPTLSYALLGLTFDALQTNRRTLYRGAKRPLAVAWTLRF